MESSTEMSLTHISAFIRAQRIFTRVKSLKILKISAMSIRSSSSGMRGRTAFTTSSWMQVQSVPSNSISFSTFPVIFASGPFGSFFDFLKPFQSVLDCSSPFKFSTVEQLFNF